MKKWKISEFTKLAGISVRTLHYYDSLGILKPSERLPNGFRLYSEKDLQRLLQILSLKFLKLDLVTIKGLLDGSILIQTELLSQKKQLTKKIDELLKAKEIIERVVSFSGLSSLYLVLKLIEMYRADYHLDKMRIQKLLSKHMLKKAAEYKQLIHQIQEERDTLSDNDLSTLCTKYLDEVYRLFPDIMQNQSEAVSINKQERGFE